MRISTSQFFLSSLNDMLAQEGKVSQLNQQIATGQTLTDATQDPAGAAGVLNLAKQIAQVTTDGTTAQNSANSVNETLSVMNEINNLLNQVRSTALQGAAATTPSAQRQALAGQVQSSLAELIQLANTQLPNGQYIFGGSQSTNQPFQQLAGTVVYNGDAGVQNVEIAPALQVPVTVSGQAAFMRVPDGNGSFAVSAGGANTGQAVATLGAVVNPALVATEHLNDTQFQVAFSAGPGTSIAYTVTSGTGAPGSPSFIASSTVVASGTYSGGSLGLSFGGVNVSFDGTPSAGDSFTVRTSQNTTVFQAIQDVINGLNAPIDSPPGARSIADQMIQGSLSTLQQAQNSLLSTEATMGTTLAEINAVQAQDNNVTTADQVALGNLQGGNLPQTIMQFNAGVTALQAAQAAYGKISGLSLFNVI